MVVATLESFELPVHRQLISVVVPISFVPFDDRVALYAYSFPWRWASVVHSRSCRAFQSCCEVSVQ